MKDKGKDIQPTLPFDVPSSEDETPTVPLVEDNPAAIRYEYPADYKKQRSELRSRSVARQALESRRSEAYTDLGGQASDEEPVENPFYEILKDTKENDVDIIDGFEHFNLQKLMEPGQFSQMTEADKKELAFQFRRYVERLQSLSQTLIADGMYLYGGFSKYGFESDDDAREYGERVSRLAETLSSYPAYDEIIDISYTHWPTGKSLKAAQQRHPRANLEDFYVVYDTKSAKLRTHHESQKAA